MKKEHERNIKQSKLMSELLLVCISYLDNLKGNLNLMETHIMNWYEIANNEHELSFLQELIAAKNNTQSSYKSILDNGGLI